MKNIFAIFLCFTSLISAQSIVNTEKFFSENKDGINIISELSGNYLKGNAELLQLNYTINTSFKNKKTILRFISGGEYITEDNQDVSNGIFAQIRFNQLISNSSRFYLFSQIQTSYILLLERRILNGAGYRFDLITQEKDSLLKHKMDVSIGIMQEEEILNKDRLLFNEQSYTNYTRGNISINNKFHLNKPFTLVNNLYFQPYLKDLSDFRFFNELSLLFESNDFLSFVIDFELRYDNKPPIMLTQTDFNIQFGIVTKF